MAMASLNSSPNPSPGAVAVEGGKAYYFGTCSRSPFDPGRFPQSLNVANGRARLDNFDAASGNLWSFRFVGGHASVFSEPRMLAATSKTRGVEDSTPSRSAKLDQRKFTLSCLNLQANVDEQQAMYLGPDLSVVPDEGRAQLWQFAQVASTRNLLPGEMHLQIRAHGTEKLLCSDDRRLNVYLLKPADAAMLDPVTGNFIFNDTWEVTPDEDPPAELLENLLQSLS
mmetsp:Transcript_69318/g.122721  ORF Transcript_69318/g.122721 Transcript_69318/m.122721 type:complete len:226 (-) Transcript_69318:49-726(-)